jgi:hypothetical protein
MPFSQYARNKILDHAHGKTAWTMPTAYVGLSTTTPNGTDGNVTEPSGNAYARVTTSGATWTTASAGAIDSAAAITFPTATGNWGTVTHVVVYDATSGGNLLWWDDLAAGQAINNGVTFSIPAGSADFAMNS